jgi:RimJ/RimL family protein N-acetyltransferase
MLEPAQYSASETLRNGQRLEIRALKPEDREKFVAAVGLLSAQSLYRRFFGVKRHFTEKETSFFVNVDFIEHVALVAVLEQKGEPVIVGGGRYVVSNPGQAEVAFAVIDEYQGQGIGSALLRHLAVIARQAGLHELIAEVLPDNAAMLKVFERSGFRLAKKRESRTLHVTLGL